MSDPKIQFQSEAGRGSIVIYGDIGWDITASDFSRELSALGEVDEIEVRINSFGGDVFQGLAIYNRLKEHKARVTVHIDGIAASAASVIAMAGDDIEMGEATFVMIHDAWIFIAGNAAALRKQADQLEAVSAQMAAIYQRRTSASMEQVREWMAEEREFTAAEAVEFGFADRMFEAERLAATYRQDRHFFKKTPRAALPERRARAERLVTEMRMQLVRN